MPNTISELLFPFEGCDPEEISWQLSLGHTALDCVDNPEFPGMSAVDACLVTICYSHTSDMGALGPNEEKSLSLLVEDALGDTSFQETILPRLIHTAILAENSAAVALLLRYAEDQGHVLRLANGQESSPEESGDNGSSEQSADAGSADTGGE